MIIISGIMPGPQGVGRLLSQLQKEAKNYSNGTTSFIFGPAGTAGGKALRKGQILKFLAALWKILCGKIRLWVALKSRRLYETDEQILLIHFQTLGYRWCKRFIEKRSKPTWIYLVDCGFFCIRSYNYIPGERTACLRCLGGKWRFSKEHNCRPIPFTNFQANKLIGALKAWTEEGKVKLLVQNRTQAELVRKHFGACATGNAEVKIVGLWTIDWPELEEIPFIEKDFDGEKQYDVVFHGSSIPAKGFIWAMELAGHCPNLKFLFPCFKSVRLSFSKSDSRPLGKSCPSNIHFTYMTWEKGLAEAVKKAKMVLVPSLWSAPIEGALLKSIIFGRSVAVVDEMTAFANELPDGLILRLPSEVKKAANLLVESVESGWRPEAGLRHEWLNEFYKKNTGLLNRLHSFCRENQNLGPQ